MAVTINTYNALTDKFFVPKLQEQIFFRSVLLQKLRKNKRTFDGGRDIRVPISYKASPNVGAWGGGTDTLTTNFVDHATQAIFDICHYRASMTMPQTEEWLNKGEAKIVDMLRAQMQLVEDSFADVLGQAVYSDGTNDSNGKKRFDGIQALMTRNGDGSEGAYGDISRASSNSTKASWDGSDNSWWNANTYAINANTSINFWKGAETIASGSTLTLAKMQQAFGLATDGNDGPDQGITSQLVFNAYLGLLDSIKRQMTSDLMAKAGFRQQNAEYNGIPLTVDNLIYNTGVLLFLNFDHLFLYCHSVCDFLATEFRQPVNQITNVKHILLMANMVSDKPRAHVQVTSITG